jgi:hypothetical protein
VPLIVRNILAGCEKSGVWSILSDTLRNGHLKAASIVCGVSNEASVLTQRSEIDIIIIIINDTRRQLLQKKVAPEEVPGVSIIVGRLKIKSRFLLLIKWDSQSQTQKQSQTICYKTVLTDFDMSVSDFITLRGRWVREWCALPYPDISAKRLCAGILATNKTLKYFIRLIQEMGPDSL